MKMKLLEQEHTHIQIINPNKKQAAADITGPLQIWPMKYILYIGINLAIIIKQYGDRKNSSGF